MKKVSIFILLIVTFLLYIIMSNSNQKKYSLSADTNVSQIKGLSKYVSQEEINDFGMRYSDIAKDKEKNATLMPLRVALENKDTNKVLSFLKDNNLSVDVRMLAKRTPLMYSTFHNDTNTTKELLKLNADFNTTDRYGLSPLAYAVQNNSIQTVKQLLKYGSRFEDVKFVQWYLYGCSYGGIESLEIDKNNNTKITYDCEIEENPTGLPRSKNAMDLFDYIVSGNLVEMAEIVLKSGYKAKTDKNNHFLVGMKKGPKETISPYATSIFFIPDFKAMLELCLEYVGKPKKEDLREAYAYCRKDLKNVSKCIQEGIYCYDPKFNMTNIFKLSTKHCSDQNGTFTPREYFAWANERKKYSEIHSFIYQYEDKVMYVKHIENKKNKKNN